MTKELIESIRRIMLPYMAKKLKEIDYEGLGESDAKEFTQDFNEILNLAIKALEQESCEDCVSRQAAIDAIFAEPLYKPGMKKRYAEEAVPAIFEKIKSLPHVQPKQIECEDAISRADVEQTVEDNILCYTHSDRPIDQDPDTECHMAIRTALRMLRKDLRKLPPVTPQPKTGHWISLDDFRGKYNENGFVCSSCGGHSDYEENFCPDCGKRMTDVPDINDGKMSEIPTGSESEAQE